MNKIFLFAVLAGAVAAACVDDWGDLCAIQAPAECDADKSGLSTDKEYKSVACNAYIKAQIKDEANACVAYDKCVKDAANAAQEEKYKAFCPADKAKCAGSDKSVNCAAWAKAGECAANADWMLSNCQNSCCPVCTGTSLLKEGVCPTTSDLCTANSADKGVTCDAWATLDHTNADSECVKNSVYMNKYCMQSCCSACFLDKNQCPTSKTRCSNLYAESTPTNILTDAAVKDNTASCAKWAKAGECAANSKWMMEYCSKDCCPICIPKAPASVPAAAVFAPISYSAPFSYSAPVSYAAPAATFSNFAAPASNFGSYGAFGGYGGALNSIPYMG
jgi:hypothetical protein